MVEIDGGLSPVESSINCGESGLGVRMFSAIAASALRPVTIDGHGSLLRRPLRMIEEPLKKLGADVRTNGGYLPVEVRGPLKGGHVIVDGSQSSQFLTGLLFALPVAENDSIIEVINPASKPYIELTLGVLNHFGIEVENHDFTLFTIKGRQKYRPASYTVEGDWSGAAFFMAMAAITGEIVIRNIDFNSVQADKRIIDVLRLAGSNVEIAPGSVTVSKGELKPFTFDISDCPDLAPPLVVLAAACDGTSVITGAGRLLIKESSRGEILEKNLLALGGQIRFNGERIEISGGRKLSHAMVQSSDDHRIVMAMASLSMLSSGGITVDHTGCVNKSYPGFMADFVTAGGKLKLV
jgi:3-phosphoshikimate 1-carboxyvinyltransferase